MSIAVRLWHEERARIARNIVERGSIEMANPHYHWMYKTRLWVHGRIVHLQHHPLCARCLREGRMTTASVVHHLRPHRGDWALFADARNWESLCKQCHDTAEQLAERRGYDKTVGADGWPADPRHPVNEK
jgi:5-methylcytosine-specific restriction endonuclease McrA